MSYALREVRTDKGWAAIHLEPEEIAAGVLRDDDLDLLEDVVLRVRTPAEATARSCLLRGEPMPVSDDGEVGTAALAEFRGKPGGAASHPDGEEVGPAPEPAAVAGG